MEKANQHVNSYLCLQGDVARGSGDICGFLERISIEFHPGCWGVFPALRFGLQQQAEWRKSPDIWDRNAAADSPGKRMQLDYICQNTRYRSWNWSLRTVELNHVFHLCPTFSNTGGETQTYQLLEFLANSSPSSFLVLPTDDNCYLLFFVGRQ